MLVGATIMILQLYSMKMKRLQGRSSCVYKYLKGDHKDLGMDKFELVASAKHAVTAMEIKHTKTIY